MKERSFSFSPKSRRPSLLHLPTAPPGGRARPRAGRSLLPREIPGSERRAPQGSPDAVLRNSPREFRSVWCLKSKRALPDSVYEIKALRMQQD